MFLREKERDTLRSSRMNSSLWHIAAVKWHSAPLCCPCVCHSGHPTVLMLLPLPSSKEDIIQCKDKSQHYFFSSLITVEKTIWKSHAVLSIHGFSYLFPEILLHEVFCIWDFSTNLLFQHKPFLQTGGYRSLFIVRGCENYCEVSERGWTRERKQMYDSLIWWGLAEWGTRIMNKGTWFLAQNRHGKKLYGL